MIINGLKEILVLKKEPERNKLEGLGFSIKYDVDTGEISRYVYMAFVTQSDKDRGKPKEILEICQEYINNKRYWQIKLHEFEGITIVDRLSQAGLLETIVDKRKEII